jgi:outer membrane receptor protein involved in Fe transport
MKSRTLYALLAGRLLAGAALDAQTPSAPPFEEVVTLSPFTVNAQEDKGYQASSTLAGSRLKTSLKDLSGAIQVVTDQFLKDTGSTDATRLLLYTTNTEVAGNDGNFSGNNGGTSDDGVRRNASPTIRVRGLASADLTRGYFLSNIDFESYNTDRVTVSRGPNGMLFGLGSPGGIMDASLKQATFKDANSVDVTVGSFGAHREVLDFNRVLVPGKIALRVIGLKKADEFMQEEPFKTEQRIYGNLVVKPFANTVFRANAEAGSRRSSNPSSLAPVSNVPGWVAAGKPIQAPGLNPGVRFGSRSANRAPIFVLNGPYDTTPILGYSLDVRSPQSATAVNMSTWVTRDNEADSSAFHRGAVMSEADRWIFDYRNHALTGSLNRQSKNFDALNLALEQTFLHKRAGIEFAYDKQHDKSGSTEQAYTNYQVDTSGFLPYTIYNPVTKVNDPVPNPNAGRTFINYRSALAETVTDRSSWRLTSFYDLDFARESRSLRWLGRHVFTGMASNQQATTRVARTQYGDAIGLDNKSIIDFNTSPTASFLATSFDRSIIGIRYLGEITGPGASNVVAPANTPKLTSFPAVMWNRAAIPNLPGEVGAWQTRTISVIDNPIAGASLNKDSVDSLALISQSYLLNKNLVFTAGWRSDKSRKWFNNQPPRTPDDIVILDGLRLPGTPTAETTGNAFSWGTVGHLPRRWQEKLGVGVSVHYGISENFQPLAGRVDVLNRPIDNPRGETKELGFALELFAGKLLVRVNKYETKSKNQSDGSLGSANIPNFERLFYNNVRSIFTGPGEANENWRNVYTLPPLGMRQAFWNPIEPNIDTTTSVSDAVNPNVTGTSDFFSKGYEIEGTYNPTNRWSITFNASSQESIKTNVLKQYSDYLAIREPQWKAMGSLIARPNGQTLQQAVDSTAILQIRTQQSKEGSILPEIRKWRFNLVNSYRFTEGRLKGWNVGGAFRWQDKAAVGYHSKLNEFGIRIQDIKRPIYGPTAVTTDAFVNYSRKILKDKVRWKVQLNVFNLLNDTKEIPVAIDDDLVVVARQLQNGLTFKLTNTFEF